MLRTAKTQAEAISLLSFYRTTSFQQYEPVKEAIDYLSSKMHKLTYTFHPYPESVSVFIL